MQIENLEGYTLYLVEQGIKVKVNADNTKVYTLHKNCVQLWKSHSCDNAFMQHKKIAALK